MDTAKLVGDLFTISPIVGILGIIVFVLWKKLEKKDQAQSELMTAHAADRKESQEKLFQVVSQNSATNLTLSGSVDNLGKTMTDKFNSLEGKIDRSQRASRSSRTLPVSPTASPAA